MARNWKFLLARILVLLWALQLIWIGWHFSPEVKDIIRRLRLGEVGAAVRAANPLYRWAESLKTIIPADATYVFVDDYAAGQEIQVRYFLAPRRHVLLSPQVPASFLFYTLRQEKALFLVIRDQGHPLDPGLAFALASPVFEPLKLPGPGQIYRVNYCRLSGGFYD